MYLDQIALVRRSFGDVLPERDALAAAFYKRLFTIAPETRALFPDDMRAQRAKLIDTLGAVVDALHDIDAVATQARALGARHARYGVTAAHYQPVGEALIWAFEAQLGRRFTAPARAAWVEAYLLVSSAMLEGARAVMK